MKLILGAYIAIIILVLSIVICHQANELTEAKISRDLWHDHALATANWRMDNYHSDYSYLTSKQKGETP